MAEVAIVTDSTACIPPQLVEKHGIGIVPVEVYFEGKSYRDGIDVTPELVYSWLSQAKKLPTTSAPPPAAFLEVFRRFQQSQILCITVASKVSAVFDSARTAAEAAKAVIPQKVIQVLDSGTATMAQGFVVLDAAREAARGKSLEEIARRAKGLLGKVNVVAFLDTLYYLAKGGRVPKAAAWVTSLLQVKPILQISQGEIRLLERARGKARAVDRLLSIMKRRVNQGGPLHVAVLHGNSSEEAEVLGERVEREFRPVELYITPFTPVMGVHTGPGLLGLAFYSGEHTAEAGLG